MANSIFEKLFKINVNDKVEEKNGLNYLSWSFAWGEVKKLYPTATYTVYETVDGCIYHTDGRTCWVKTGVTIEGLEHIEYLPVMDYKNKSITIENVTSFDVNKAIQRSLTKALARHGLGLYVYAGEDLPEEETKLKEIKTDINRKIKDYAKLTQKPVTEVVAELGKVVDKDLKSIDITQGKKLLDYLEGKISAENRRE